MVYGRQWQGHNKSILKVMPGCASNAGKSWATAGGAPCHIAAYAMPPERSMCFPTKWFCFQGIKCWMRWALLAFCCDYKAAYRVSGVGCSSTFPPFFLATAIDVSWKSCKDEHFASPFIMVVLSGCQDWNLSDAVNSSLDIYTNDAGILHCWCTNIKMPLPGWWALLKRLHLHSISSDSL